jgi:peptidyl-prolyl cis-trans isomerase C
MITNQLGDDGQAQFTKILGQFGVSEKDVLDEVKRQQATARLFQAVTAKVVSGVTADDARAYFQADPSRFATPERRRIRNIVVATHEQARAIISALRQGADFAALARRRSLDDATRASGGDLGTVTAAQLESAYATAAFHTPRGRVFGPLETKFGWNVGEVVGVKPATAVTYDQVSAQVLDALRSERAMAAWRSYLAAQIKKAHVRYADDFRPEHPDAPPADQPGAQTGSLAGQQ